MSGLELEPPPMKVLATAVALASYAAENVAELKLTVPSVFIVMPTRPAEPELLVPVDPLKAPSTELSRPSAVGSPSNGPAVPAEVPEPGVNAVAVLRSEI